MADPFVLGAVRFCQNPKFFQFLESKRCGRVTEKESAADGLRRLCGIPDSIKATIGFDLSTGEIPANFK